MASKFSSMSGKDSDELIIKPLGGGQEVGRSCIMLQFKGKTLLLDMGIHPGQTGFNSLPYLEQAVLDKVDLLLVTHFHLDHCGALPYFLNHTTFRGKCFMTPATKAIYRWFMADFLRVSTNSSGNQQHRGAVSQAAAPNTTDAANQQLFDEHDLERSMDMIETIDFHEELEHNGIRFTAYMAGHVLGAAQFLIEIAGVKVLYTGDFSCAEDRHLCAAEVPPARPDVIIMESTYGTRVHDSREVRERRFLNYVHQTVSRGGKVLIPCFALGRAQELQLILDEYWSQRPELQDIPIYYASALATKCLSVYKTYTNAMNDRVKRRINLGGGNPFDFKFIQAIKGREDVDSDSPCVVLASPGMLQSGLSRQLFEAWCPDARNTCIIAGYCVEGTLAKQILTEPLHITGQNGNRIERKCEVHYISFSAHTDYEQTHAFLRQLKPNLIVLVHGQSEEMHKLRRALIRDFQPQIKDLSIFMPANGKQVVLRFRTEKSVKVLGTLASESMRHNDDGSVAPPEDGTFLQGMVIRKNFQYMLAAVEEVGSVVNVAPCEISQKVSVHFEGDLAKLSTALQTIYSEVEWQTPNSCVVLGCIHLVHERPILYVQWKASAAADMMANVVLACALDARDLPDIDLKEVDKNTSLEPIYNSKSNDDISTGDDATSASTHTKLNDFEYERFWRICHQALCDRYGPEMVTMEGEDKSATSTKHDADDADDDEEIKSDAAGNGSGTIGGPLTVRMLGGLHTMRVDLKRFSVHEVHAENNNNKTETAAAAAVVDGGDDNSSETKTKGSINVKLRDELCDIIGQLYTAFYPIDMWCHAPAMAIESNSEVAPTTTATVASASPALL